MLPVNSTNSSSAASSSSSAASSSSVNSSSSSSSSTTARPAVDVALDKLSLSNVQILWNDHTKGESFFTFTGFVGRFTYLWNKSTAVELDKAHGATIELFNTKLAELVVALKDRGLTTAESTAIGVAPVRYNSLAQQELDANHKLAAEKKEKEFYDVFKTRCTQRNVDQNSDDFIVFANAAAKGLNNHAKTMDVMHKNTLIEKIKTASLSFNEKVYTDMVNAYSSQDVALITPENFNKKVDELKALFPKNTVDAIRQSLRVSVATEDNKTKMRELAGKYLNADSNMSTNATLKGVRDNLAQALNDEKAVVEAKMAELRGPNTNNGTIKAAYDRQVAVQAEVDAALAEVVAERGALPGQASTADQWVALGSIEAATASDALKTAYAKLVTKHTALTAAKKELADLVAELAVLAQWQPNSSNITGGRFNEIATQLAQIDAQARTRSNLLGNVFNWFCA